MNENPHDKEDLEKKDENLSEDAEKSSLSEDQKRRSYYYDDACGYEVYNPETDETEED